MEKTKILIVDDHPENIVALSELIANPDLEIHSANGADGALAHLLDHDFALALLDVQMPEVSGFELAQLLRGVQKTRHLPVIFVTAQQPDQRIVFQGYESGAVDLLFKPLDPHIVRSKVRTFIELDKQNKLLKSQMEEVESLRQKAEQANLSKSQFLANMSHEIRTPLASVLGFSDVLTQESLNEEEIHDSVSAIRRNGELLLRLIDDILDLSRIEAHQLHFMKSDFVLGELLADIESTLKLKADEQGICFHIVTDANLNAIYHSDVARVKQVLLNVIGNAIKFTEKGSVTVKLNITPSEASNGETKLDHLSFEVKDTGIGISEAQTVKLFQPFSQADLSTRKKFGGTGLGLVISQQLAKSLNGHLRLVSSKPNEGSTFEILMDLERSHSVETKRTEMRTELRKAIDLAGTKILVVDDVSDNRLLIERYMQGTHARIIVAGSGMEAIELTRSENPDLVLMDIQMPEMDGYETVRRIRSAGYKRPIIALTAHAMKEEGQKCLEAGCNSVLTKPARRHDLLTKISNVLDMH